MNKTQVLSSGSTYLPRGWEAGEQVITARCHRRMGTEVWGLGWGRSVREGVGGGHGPWRATLRVGAECCDSSRGGTV